MAAFEELYRRHGGRLFNVACRMTGSAADAEDLLQDVFLQVYRRIGSYRGEAALGTWLYRLAVNACLDHLRSHQSRQRKATDFIEDVEGLEPVAHPSWQPDVALDRLDLESAISRLPPSYRAAFVLHDVEGHLHHEVADMLGIAEGTSKSLLHKARMRLRAFLRGVPAGEAGRPSAAATGAGPDGKHGES
jgi:RNA polymerase sigma-70 factor (ECF subfamily)